MKTDVSESGLSDVGWKPEDWKEECQWARNRRIQLKPTSLGNLASSGVLIVESGDEEDRFATGVYLVMDRPLRAKGTLTWFQGIPDEPSTVLFDEASFHLSVHEVEDFIRPWVGVRGIHAAWSGSVG